MIWWHGHSWFTPIFLIFQRKTVWGCLRVSYAKTRHHNQKQPGRKRFISMPSSLVILLPLSLSDFFIIYFSLWLFFAGVLICCLCFTYMTLVWLTCPGSQFTEGSQGKNLEAETKTKAMGDAAYRLLSQLLWNSGLPPSCALKIHAVLPTDQSTQTFSQFKFIYPANSSFHQVDKNKNKQTKSTRTG